MTEQPLTQPAIDKAGLGFRSRLLSPVMEGNELESDDVCSFLAGRLSAEEDDEKQGSDRWWVGFPVS
jgi:hypothetical protein